MERTAGKWIIEASDLAGMKKAGVEKLKSMLSRQKDSDRMVYDKLSTERKRQFIIVGTTNSEKYLQDQTGNRRFWPVRVIKFNVHGIKKERDQLWAEAYTLEQSGASIRMPQELWHLAAIQQEKRRTEDPWEDILEPNFDEQHAYRLTKEQVWMLLGVSSSYRDENAEARIAAIMPRLGFRRGKVSVAGKKYNGWCRGERTGPQALPLGLADGTEDVTEENE
jgi:predicted P-loop ATPase